MIESSHLHIFGQEKPFFALEVIKKSLKVLFSIILQLSPQVCTSPSLYFQDVFEILLLFLFFVYQGKNR